MVTLFSTSITAGIPGNKISRFNNPITYLLNLYAQTSGLCPNSNRGLIFQTVIHAVSAVLTPFRTGHPGLQNCLKRKLFRAVLRTCYDHNAEFIFPGSICRPDSASFFRLVIWHLWCCPSAFFLFFKWTRTKQSTVDTISVLYQSKIIYCKTWSSQKYSKHSPLSNDNTDLKCKACSNYPKGVPVHQSSVTILYTFIME